ncbi:MAG: hypothetical protein GJ680_12065 [Alteromonadaceae bacterium]|nr:hypothetical protein [Alteromonadaceae bacterium]
MDVVPSALSEIAQYIKWVFGFLLGKSLSDETESGARTKHRNRHGNIIAVEGS